MFVIQTYSRSDGDAVFTESAESAADEPHPRVSACPAQPPPDPDAQHGEGGGGVQELQAGRPRSQNQGHDAVRTDCRLCQEQKLSYQFDRLPEIVFVKNKTKKCFVLD